MFQPTYKNGWVQDRPELRCVSEMIHHKLRTSNYRILPTDDSMCLLSAGTELSQLPSRSPHRLLNMQAAA
jgi:hypothetical protein